HGGRPFRTLYAFDPRRSAILPIGGDKTGDDRWYELNVPIADRLYDEHLHQLREED
ncbi:type II toxin-antitoxin system RelE/ParE family toxin, partial [Pseudomonas aeruginosa]|uniref:type II toxin-antitoxin system RelE/ParE family toxin n=2 Tax=Pseudomonas TaxID=286 RepID=UPI0023592DC4